MSVLRGAPERRREHLRECAQPHLVPLVPRWAKISMPLCANPATILAVMGTPCHRVRLAASDGPDSSSSLRIVSPRIVLTRNPFPKFRYLCVMCFWED
ncbi:hypothetical protein E2C01_015406 [Portunus trituberculatus]|uniref:Uncharacterized protein n=1 Tax=Portunus trituberculatus TaxID=210409 RepID=A0A5B7DLG2_PORTR|nr:hypothetical protein [Portunus trituberculatus]